MPKGDLHLACATMGRELVGISPTPVGMGIEGDGFINDKFFDEIRLTAFMEDSGFVVAFRDNRAITAQGVSGGNAAEKKADQE